MLFREVVGQEKVKHHLIETFQAGRTAHAQILLGNEGNGQLALALAYAQYLQCQNPSATDACGQCNACYKAARYIHPDIHFAYPTIGTGKLSTDYIKEWREILQQNPYLNTQEWLQKLGAENQQGNINKNECVDIVKKLSLKAVEGRYKILILWLPEFLGKEGNRLLKLIEEPEPDTVFLLVAEQEDKILNTILSRCQLVQVGRLNDEEVATYLVEKYQANIHKAKTIAYLSEGNLAKGISLLDSIEDDNADIWLHWLQQCEDGNGLRMMRWVESITTNSDKEGSKKWGRKDYIVFLQYALHFLRELLLFKYTQDAESIRLSPPEAIKARQLSTRLSLAQIQKITALLDDCCFYIERNAAAKILFLDTSIRLHKILKTGS